MVALTFSTWFSQTLFQSRQTQHKSEPESKKSESFAGSFPPTTSRILTSIRFYSFHWKGNIILWQPFPHFSNSSLFRVALPVWWHENNIQFETECCFQTWLNKNNEVKRYFNHPWPHFFLTLYKKENNHNHLAFRRMMEKQDCHNVSRVFTFTTPGRLVGLVLEESLITLSQQRLSGSTRRCRPYQTPRYT